MFHAIVIIVVLIIIAKLAKTPCGCGCWRWEDCQAACCKEDATQTLLEAMSDIAHGERSRQLLTGSLANAHIPDPGSVTTYVDVPPPARDGVRLPAALMPLRTITFHGTAWCTGCALMTPAWNKLRQEVPGIVYVDVNEDVAKTPGIMGYPTIILRDPIGTTQYRGPPDYEHLRRWATAPVPYWI